jgi:hypothetical protein
MNKTVIWTFVVFLFVIFVGIFSTQMQQKPGGGLKVYSRLPDFEFTDSAGQPFKRTSLYGRVSLFEFSLNSTQDSTSALKTSLRPILSLSNTFQLISIIKVDTSVVSSTSRTDNSHFRLLGSEKNIQIFMEKGMLLPKDGLSEIAEEKVVLVDSKARIRGYYDKNGDPEKTRQLLDDIKTLLTEL